MDKLTRPLNMKVMNNGCAQTALATLTERDPVDFLKYADIKNGRHTGTTLRRICDALQDAGIKFCLSRLYGNRRFAVTLPLQGRGIIVVNCGGRDTHAIAYNGKLAFDARSGLRWQWAYDHPLARYKAKFLIEIVEA